MPPRVRIWGGTSQIVNHQQHPHRPRSRWMSPSKKLLTLIVSTCYRAASADQAREQSLRARITFRMVRGVYAASDREQV